MTAKQTRQKNGQGALQDSESNKVYPKVRNRGGDPLP